MQNNSMATKKVTKEVSEKPKAVKAVKAVKTPKVTKEVSAPVVKSVIIGPRITEKAAYATEKNVYVFNVETSANKIQIKKAMFDQYKVKPIKVAIVTIKPKKVVFRGRLGTQQGSKKAMVYLKKGDTIEIN